MQSFIFYVVLPLQAICYQSFRTVRLPTFTVTQKNLQSIHTCLDHTFT